MEWHDSRTVEELKSPFQVTKNDISYHLVVYNHVSQYDENALKIIDYDYYFKQFDKTGCGNELETRRKMVRRLVLDSLSYWVKAYHIDGFRFDLATSHDVETVQAIYDTLTAINPNIYIIAEPWGGEGASTRTDFRNICWSMWSDDNRNANRGGDNRPTGAGKSFMLGNAFNAPVISNHWKEHRALVRPSNCGVY